MPAGLFGITDETVNLVVNLVVLFLVVLWLALIAWTYFDARRRIEDPVLVAFATAASFFPYVGAMVYSILRPPEYLEDKHERELEVRAAELRVRRLEEQSCPNCQHPVERTFLRCPSCRARIKNPCPSCAEPIDPRWSLCPYCETALRRVPSERRPVSAKPRETADRRAQPTEASAPVPRSQRPQQRKPQRAQRTAKPAAEAEGKPAASASDDGSAPVEPERSASAPEPKQRKQASKRPSGRRTSSRPRS